MQLSIREGMIPRDTLQDKIAWLQAVGLDAVELHAGTMLLPAEEIREAFAASPVAVAGSGSMSGISPKAGTSAGGSAGPPSSCRTAALSMVRTGGASSISLSAPVSARGGSTSAKRSSPPAAISDGVRRSGGESTSNTPSGKPSANAQRRRLFRGSVLAQVGQV